MITGTSGISGLTGGNCSREEYQEYQRIHAEAVANGFTGWDGRTAEDIARSAQRVFLLPEWRGDSACPRPELTEAQAARVAMHRAHTKARMANPKTMFPTVFPLFDEEPSQWCTEAGCVQNVSR